MESLPAALRRAVALLLVMAGCGQAVGQKAWEYGGYFESTGQFYDRTPNPSDTHALGASRFQLWSRARISSNLSWRGTYDFRIDTHRDVDRSNWLDVSDRGLQQPAGTLSEFYFDLKLNHMDLRVGKQQIRWGRADAYNPTDNLDPYDYIDTSRSERIAVPAFKVDTYFGGAHLEGAWIPTFTPTRLPLLGQRWFPPLPTSASLPIAQGEPPARVDLAYSNGSRSFPPLTFGNGQWALRWNQVVRRAEFSLSYFDGFDDIASFSPAQAGLLEGTSQWPVLVVSLNSRFYRVRVAGADFATELGPFGIRGEVAYYDQTDPNNQDHVLAVIGIDRSWADWSAVVEYADIAVAGDYTHPPSFPDLALRSTIMWRIERTLGPSQSVEVTGAVALRDGGFFVQPLYSRALTNRWRLKVGGSILAGPADSYFGQFSRNDSLSLQLRYTF